MQYPNVVSSSTYKKKKVIFKTYRIIWYILGLIEVLLVLRFLLKLMGASLASPFTRFIYDISYPFAYPFLGVLSTSAAPEGFIFEWSTLVAMLIYLIIAYGIIYSIRLIKPTTPEEVEEAVEEV